MSHTTETAANVLTWLSIAILAGFFAELTFQVCVWVRRARPGPRPVGAGGRPDSRGVGAAAAPPRPPAGRCGTRCLAPCRGAHGGTAATARACCGPLQLVLFGLPWLKHWGNALDYTVVTVSFVLGGAGLPKGQAVCWQQQHQGGCGCDERWAEEPAGGLGWRVGGLVAQQLHGMWVPVPATMR